MSKRAVSARVQGYVQGVGFRYSAMVEANRLKLKGWVRNEYDGSVTVECEGESSDVESFINWLRSGPSHSRVSRVDVRELPYRGVYSRFSIEY